MKEQGCSVVIITHKLNEVMEISDRVTVLRKGRSIGTVVTGDTDVSGLVEMMVGKKVDLSIEKKKFSDKKPLLQLDEITVLNGEGKEAVSGVSFDINSHEIVGVAGVANSGQKELCEAIAGLVKTQKGRIFFDGENIVGHHKAGDKDGIHPRGQAGNGPGRRYGYRSQHNPQGLSEQAGIHPPQGALCRESEEDRGGTGYTDSQHIYPGQEAVGR